MKSDIPDDVLESLYRCKYSVEILENLESEGVLSTKVAEDRVKRIKLELQRNLQQISIQSLTDEESLEVKKEWMKVLLGKKVTFSIFYLISRGCFFFQCS